MERRANTPTFSDFYVVNVRTSIFEYQALRQVQKFYTN
jgi:hypothetical protein